MGGSGGKKHDDGRKEAQQQGMEALDNTPGIGK
jgi:hypothetical protein